MRAALKILNSVADAGMNPRSKDPQEQEKRSSLLSWLFMNKYDREKHLAKTRQLGNEVENVQEKA